MYSYLTVRTCMHSTVQYSTVRVILYQVRLFPSESKEGMTLPNKMSTKTTSVVGACGMWIWWFLQPRNHLENGIWTVLGDPHSAIKVHNCTMTDHLAPASAPSSTAPAALTGGSSVEDHLNSLLSSPNFSVASYLNLALSKESATGNSEELQRRMAELALHLQLQTQSCHEDIGRIGAELQAILPRCAADVGRVGVGLEGMKVDAQTLLDTAGLQGEGEGLSGSLETLSTLHALQSNLSRTKEILTAAATWDSTIASIPPLLAQQNLTDAVDALAQLEHGERALKGMPQRHERQEAIAKIRAQVQILLQPQLNHALQNMNSRLAPLQQCVALYSKLDKMDALQEEYVKNRPGEVHKAWFAFSPSIDATSTADNVTNASDFSTWLPSWYETILSLLTEERRQSSTVFGAEVAPEILVMVRLAILCVRKTVFYWYICL
jgi:hypothetical protein